MHKFLIEQGVDKNNQVRIFCEKVRKTLEEVIMMKNVIKTFIFIFHLYLIWKNYNQMLVHALFTIQRQEQHLSNQAKLLEYQNKQIQEKEANIKDLQKIMRDNQVRFSLLIIVLLVPQ